jgi:hypothetical protein
MAIVSAWSVFVELVVKKLRRLSLSSSPLKNTSTLASASSSILAQLLHPYLSLTRWRVSEPKWVLVRSKVHYVGSPNNTGQHRGTGSIALDRPLHLMHPLGRLLESPHPIRQETQSLQRTALLFTPGCRYGTRMLRNPTTHSLDRSSGRETHTSGGHQQRFDDPFTLDSVVVARFIWFILALVAAQKGCFWVLMRLYYRRLAWCQRGDGGLIQRQRLIRYTFLIFQLPSAV